MSQIQISGEAKIRDLQGPVVANSGVITALDGLPSQYVRGDGTLADIPSVTGGGASVSYYLNGSVNQGTFGGSTYYELGENAITGVGTNFSTSTNGLLAQFITDAGVPDVTEIPSGNWNIEFYMGVSASSGALASFYVDIFKYDGTTFTLIGSNSSTPDFLTNTTTVDAYFTSVAMPLTAMAETDRIAIRVYANVAGKTVTLYTEDNRLCQVVTTFSRGMLSLNSLTDQQQYLTVGTAGTDFNIVSSVDTHTFNIPSASATNRGLITTGTQSIGGVKTFLSSTIQEGLSVLKNDAFQVIPSGYTALTGYGLGGLTILQGDGTNVYNTDLDFPNTSNRQYTFPDITGTVALLQGTQTFTGSKTFTGLNTFANDIIIDSGVSGNTLSFKQYSSGVTGGVGYTSLYAQGSDTLGINFGNIKEVLLSNSLLTTIRQYQFPDLSGTFALLEGSQTFTGSKTFTGFNSFTGNTTRFSNGAYFDKGGSPSGLTTFTTNLYSESGSNNLVIADNDSNAKLQFQAIGDYDYTFPASSGTVALTSNLSAYVPYTGATGSVNLGIYTLNAGNIDVNGISTSGGAIRLKQNGIINTGPIGYTTLSSAGAGLLDIYFGDSNLYSVELTNNLLTANRVYNFPNASGTLALTSNLSTYLPLTGGTLTGALNGTSATFSGTIQSTTTSTNPAFLAILPANANATILQSYSSNSGFGFKIQQDEVSTGDFRIFRRESSVDYQVLNLSRSTGAATFSSSVTATSAIFSNSSVLSLIMGTPQLRLINNATATINQRVDLGLRWEDGTYNGIGGISMVRESATARLGRLVLSGINSAGDPNEAVNITGGGNVGIGTSSPDRKLSVLSSGAGVEAARFTDGARADLIIGFPSDGVAMITSEYGAGGALAFGSGTSRTERMRITSGGKVQINTTGTSKATMLDIVSSSGTASIACQVFGNGDNAVNFFNGSGTYVASIVVNASSVAYNTSSDYRLKKDLKDFNGLNLLSNFKVYDFAWKTDDTRTYGVIAHELAEILPSAVSGEKDGEQIQGVDYSKIVPVLVKGLQEEDAKVNAQELRIQQLESQIDELKALIAAK